MPELFAHTPCATGVMVAGAGTDGGCAAPELEGPAAEDELAPGSDKDDEPAARTEDAAPSPADAAGTAVVADGAEEEEPTPMGGRADPDPPGLGPAGPRPRPARAPPGSDPEGLAGPEGRPVG